MATKIQSDSPVVRETANEYRGKPLIVELHPGYLTVHRKRERDFYMVTYADLYEFAMRVAAIEKKNGHR